MTARDELLALADSIEGWGETFGGKQSPGIVKIPLTKSDRAAIVAALRDHRARPPTPVKCVGGEDIGWEECPKCGATMDDECKFALTTPSQGDAGARETYIEICKNKNCPRGGLPVEIVAPVPPDAGWLAPALDKAAARAAKMPGWMTRSSSATPSDAGAHQSAPISQAAQNTAESDPSVMPGYVGAGTVPSNAGALREALEWYADKNNWISMDWPDDGGCTDHAIPMTSQEGALVCDCGDRARAALAAPAPATGETEAKAADVLTEIIDHFAVSKETPGDWWAHGDDGQSYCLDHRARDGAKFWLDLDKDGTITLLWKATAGESPRVIKFAASPPAPDRAEVTEALEAALPYLETLHSLLPLKTDARKSAFKIVQQARAALTPGSGDGSGA